MNYLLSALIAVVISGIGLFAKPHEAPPQGTTNLIAGQTYYLAGSGVSSSATSITLTSLTLPQNGYKIQDSDLSDLFYITLEPGNRTKQEIVSCTTVSQNAAGTATLSGCTRGLSPVTPHTASSTLQFAHGGSTQVIFSDPPQVFNQFAALQNTAYITGSWGFQGTAPTSTGCTLPFELCNKAYVDATANAGAATSTFLNGGIVELATHAEVAAGTASSSPTGPLVVSTGMTNATPGSCNTVACVVVATAGKIAQGFLDLTANFTWTGNHTFTTATSTTLGIATTLNWNGLGYTIGSARQASSTVLAENGSGRLSWIEPRATTIDVQAPNTASASSATTTLKTVAIPANTLTTTSALRVTAMFYLAVVSSGNCGYQIDLGNGNSTSTLAFGDFGPSQFEGMVFATSTNRQSSIFSAGTAGGTSKLTHNFSAYDNTGTLYIAFRSRAQTDSTCALAGATVEKLQN